MPNTTADNTIIHDSATIDPSAVIGEGVVIEAGALVGPGCVIGDGCRLRARSMIIEHTTLGAGCDVHPYAVLGGDPQDFKYNPETPGSVVIGDGCVFREGVTVHRSVGDEQPTTIGSACYLMACSHVGHNSIMGDNVTLANGSLLAGHVRVGARCFFGGNAMVHQYTDLGEGVMIRGGGGATMHAPPYTVVSKINDLSGVNIVGLRRTENCTRRDITEVSRVYRLLYRERLPLGAALKVIEQQQWGIFAQRMIDFIHRVRAYGPPRVRGLMGPDI